MFEKMGGRTYQKARSMLKTGSSETVLYSEAQGRFDTCGKGNTERCTILENGCALAHALKGQKLTIITDPYFYMLAIPAVLLYGMAKGGLGPAVGSITVPALSLVIHPVQAAALMLPILCVMDIFAVWNFRRQFDTHHLKILLPAGIAGIVIASLLMGHLPPNAIRLFIGVIAIAFCLNYWFNGGSRKKKKGGRFSGYLWGTVAGFTSTQIHAGGPPISIYLLPQNLDKVMLMGTLAVFFAVMNYLKLIPYTFLGAFSSENLLTSAVLMPLAPIGVKLGYLVLHKVSQKIIYRFLYIALFFSGAKLLYDGIF